MEHQTLSLNGLILITPRFFKDDRGFFFEGYHAEKFAKIGIDIPFIQDNQSHSTSRVLRGLHYQEAPYEQGKLVRVLSGKIYDVAVDIRPESPTFGQWEGMTLCAEDQAMLYIPPGFAHGFFVASDTADVLYKCTALYNPAAERSIRWDDPKIGIKWPISKGVQPSLSPKDADAPFLREIFGR